MYWNGGGDGGCKGEGGEGGGKQEMGWGGWGMDWVAGRINGF